MKQESKPCSAFARENRQTSHQHKGLTYPRVQQPVSWPPQHGQASLQKHPSCPDPTRQYEGRVLPLSIFMQLATEPFADIKNTPAGSPLQEFQRGQLGGGEEEAAMRTGAHRGSPGANPSTERCSSQLGLLCRGMPQAAGSTRAGPGEDQGGKEQLKSSRNLRDRQENREKGWEPPGGLREELGLLWLSNKGGGRDCWHREGWGGHG